MWTRQHPTIEIDQAIDGISDDGNEIYEFLQRKSIKNYLLVGVHANRCILNRSFGIKQMLKMGMNVILVRDLTDVIYNPAKPPFISIEEAKRRVVEYIEKYFCPTISSENIIQK